MSGIYRQVDDVDNNQPSSSGTSNFFDYLRFSLTSTSKKDPDWLQNVKKRREKLGSGGKVEHMNGNQNNPAIIRPKRKRKSSTPICKRDMDEEADDEDGFPIDSIISPPISHQMEEENRHAQAVVTEETVSSETDDEEEMPELVREETMNEIIMEEAMMESAAREDGVQPKEGNVIQEAMELGSPSRDQEVVKKQESPVPLDESHEASPVENNELIENNKQDETAKTSVDLLVEKEATVPSSPYRTRSKTVADRTKPQEAGNTSKTSFSLQSIEIELMKNAKQVVAMGAQEFVLPACIWDDDSDEEENPPTTIRKLPARR